MDNFIPNAIQSAASMFNQLKQNVGNYFNPESNAGQNFWSTPIAQGLGQAQQTVQNTSRQFAQGFNEPIDQGRYPSFEAPLPYSLGQFVGSPFGLGAAVPIAQEGKNAFSLTKGLIGAGIGAGITAGSSLLAGEKPELGSTALSGALGFLLTGPANKEGLVPLGDIKATLGGMGKLQEMMPQIRQNRINYENPSYMAQNLLKEPSWNEFLNKHPEINNHGDKYADLEKGPDALRNMNGYIGYISTDKNTIPLDPQQQAAIIDKKVTTQWTANNGDQEFAILRRDKENNPLQYAVIDRHHGIPAARAVGIDKVPAIILHKDGPPLSDFYDALKNGTIEPVNIKGGIPLEEQVPSLPSPIGKGPSLQAQKGFQTGGGGEGEQALTPEKIKELAPELLTENKNQTYVKNEPFNLSIGKNEKETAGNIRAETVGIRNAQIVRGNNLRDSIQKSITPSQDRALVWYREAGGNINTLQKWFKDSVSNPNTIKYHEDIKNALNLSPNAKQIAGIEDSYFNQAGQLAKTRGSINDILENYQNRIYKPEPPKEFPQTQMGGGIKTSTYHAKQRIYPTLYDAVSNGKQLVEDDTNNHIRSSDLLAIHNEEMAHVNTSRQMTAEMKNANIGGWFNPGNIPAGWKQVGTMQNSRPFLDKNGNAHIASQIFAAPEGIANGLGALADPNFAKRISTIRQISKYQGLIKTIDLSFSLFHHATLIAQTLYQRNPQGIISLIKRAPIGEFEEDFARHGGETSKTSDNQDVMRSLIDKEGDIYSKFTNTPIIKQALQLAQKNTDLLFGTGQRYLKVMDYANKTANWIKNNPQATDTELIAAKRGFAKEINAAYGGLNWEQMGVSKSMQTLGRSILLALDWTVSNMALAKYAFEKGTAGTEARAHILTALIGGFIATQAVNKLITGHFTDQNDKGHEMEVQVAPRVYISLFRGGIGDIVKLASMTAESGLQGVSRFAEGKLSPLARLGTTALSSVDYTGRSIYKGKNAVEKTISGIGNLASEIAPVPFGASTMAKYVAGGQTTPIGTTLVASGLARYSAGGNKNPPAAGTPQDIQRKVQSDTLVQQVIKSGYVTPEQKDQFKNQLRLLEQQKKDLQTNQGFLGIGSLSADQKAEQINQINKEEQAIKLAEKTISPQLNLTGNSAVDKLLTQQYYTDLGKQIKNTLAQAQAGLIPLDQAGQTIQKLQQEQQSIKQNLPKSNKNTLSSGTIRSRLPISASIGTTKKITGGTKLNLANISKNAKLAKIKAMSGPKLRAGSIKQPKGKMLIAKVKTVKTQPIHIPSIKRVKLKARSHARRESGYIYE